MAYSTIRVPIREDQVDHIRGINPEIPRHHAREALEWAQEKARSLQYSLPAGEDADQFLADAALLCFYAAEKFVPRRGAKFSTFARLVVQSKLFHVIGRARGTGQWASQFSERRKTIPLDSKIQATTHDRYFNAYVAEMAINALQDSDQQFVARRHFLEGETLKDALSELGIESKRGRERLIANMKRNLRSAMVPLYS